jgi:hypothetical protein
VSASWGFLLPHDRQLQCHISKPQLPLFSGSLHSFDGVGVDGLSAVAKAIAPTKVANGNLGGKKTMVK